MIWGSGVDIVNVRRVESIIARHGERFLNKVFTAGEIAYCRRRHYPQQNFAARIAAKEAGSKAIGTGWRQGVQWKHFEVTRAPSGKPSLVVHGRAKEILEDAGVSNMALSMSHDENYAIAHVILETG
ncbi:MAG: holo-ACP synthase [Armatimonadetes bacterium]|nr:holo-ACP synthase [Armatimonadota bacterium]